MKKRGAMSSSVKGEAVERLLGSEITSAVPTASGKQISTRSWFSDGMNKSSEWDLIFRGDWTGGETNQVVKGDHVVCAIEVKSDLKKSDIQGGQDSINAQIQEAREFTDAPIFVVGIRHDHTPDQLRTRSLAEETVAFGDLSEAGSAEKMTNKGEFDRLVTAVKNAVRNFE